MSDVRRRDRRWAGAAALMAAIVAMALPAASLARDQGPEQPSSFGQAGLYHLTFAADISFETFLPVSNTDVFVEGSPLLLSLVGWQFAPAGTELRLRLYLDDRLVFEDARSVISPNDSGFVFAYEPDGGAPAGTYTAQLDYNGVPEEVASFRVVPEGDPLLAGGQQAAPIGTSPDPDPSPGAPTERPGASPVASPGTGTSPVTSPDASGTAGASPPASPAGTAGTTPVGEAPDAGPEEEPEGVIPYADRESVLVVTRESVLRANLGSDADRVLVAATAVGEVRDLESDGQRRETPEELRDEVHELLEGGGYRYLLILGGDDAVPFFQLENPLADGETPALEGWDLPADWYPSDDPYTDLDGDQLGVPDLPIARIPSSDDAELLLTQLGEVTTSAGGGYAYLNQSWRAHSGVVSEVMDDYVPVIEDYSPPMDAARIAEVDEDNQRYFYVSMHGIGAATDNFVADVYAWVPRDFDDLRGEWIVQRGGQVTSMDVANALAPGAVIKLGTCYGTWTIDTTTEPSHKTAENSIALSYLRSGTRALVGETHISYAFLIGTDGPYISASGYEILFWRHLLSGMTPIDAFHRAKVDLASVLRQLLDLGEVEAALVNEKTLHEEVYFGRP